MAGQSRRKNRRKTKVVNRPAQARMVRRICLLPLLGLTVMSCVIGQAVMGLLLEVGESGVSLSSLPFLLWSLVVLVGASGALIILPAFRFSYRIAGPTYRILKSLEEFRQHGPDFRIQLRAGDELQDLASKLNDVMQALQAEARGNVGAAEGETSSAPEPSCSEMAASND